MLKVRRVGLVFVSKTRLDLCVRALGSGRVAPWKRSQQIVPRASKSYIRIRKNKGITPARLCMRLEVAGVSKTLSEVSYTRSSPKRDQTKP
jgi:hypothetical protein